MLRRSKQHDHIPAGRVGKCPGLMVNFDQDIKEKGRASGIVGRLTSYSWWGEGTDETLYCWRTLGSDNPKTEVLMKMEGRFLLVVWNKEKKRNCYLCISSWLSMTVLQRCGNDWPRFSFGSGINIRITEGESVEQFSHIHRYVSQLFVCVLHSGKTNNSNTKNSFPFIYRYY